MKCAHCRASGAGHTWDLRACADGGQERTFHLCTTCDVALNRIVLEFVDGDAAASKIAAYEATR